MSTENTTHANRPSRRASYGDDLDTPVITHHQQTKPRASSNDRVFRDEHVTTHNDGVSQNFQRRYDASPEQHSPINKKDHRVNAIVDTDYQRSSSTSGLERIVEQNMNNNRHRSTYTEEDDRRKYIHEGEKLSYGSGASAIVHIPVVTQRSDSTNERFRISGEPTRHDDGSRSPSVTSNDSYRRQDIHDRQTDFTGKINYFLFF
jgi:hypothetical protein